MKTRCLIVDDEPLAQRIIENHMSKIPNLQLVATCSNAMEAFEVLMSKQIDLVFLDIQMPEFTGVDLIKTVKQGPAIIFTTAYRDYAIDAFELDAIDYLLKPISFERFFKAVTKYFQLQQTHISRSKPEENHSTTEEYIYVKANRKIQKVVIAQILFIESLKDYVKIHLADGDVVITKEKISALEKRLTKDKFVRTHRSFLAASRHIKSFTTETIDIANQEIPIGRTYKNSVMTYLGYHE